MRQFSVLMCICFASFAYGQSPKPQPCSAPETRQFDFSIGDWDLTWSDTVHATNHIERIFGNCTVQENFKWPGNMHGKSWSVYNANYGIWEQTWVDDKGGYTSVHGRLEGDSMVLYTNELKVPASISPSGKIVSRMVYRNITPQSFDWDWQSSADGGRLWKSNWLIHYRRKRA